MNVYARIFPHVLSSLILLELTTFAYGEGETCGPANNKPCSIPGSTHIDALNVCVVPYKNNKRSWTNAKHFCHARHKSFLVEPNTLEGAKGIADFARKNFINRFWIGLDFDSINNVYFWSEYGNTLSKEMLRRFGSRLRKDSCVEVQDVNSILAWGPRRCGFRNSLICSQTSAFMPSRPTISVDHTGEDSVQLIEGSEMKVSCEAVLSRKGNLRIIIFSSNESQSFGYGHSRVHYFTSLKKDKDGLCKKNGAIHVTLELTLDMDGKTLACVSFTHKAFEMCSPHDQYCSVAGTINVSPSPGFISVVFSWWAPVVIVALMFLSMLVLPKFKKRHHGEDSLQGQVYDGYGEGYDSAETSAETSSNSSEYSQHLWRA